MSARFPDFGSFFTRRFVLGVVLAVASLIGIENATAQSIVPPVPVTRGSLVVDPGSRRLYLVGGRTPSGPSHDVWVRDLASFSGWQLLLTNGSAPAMEWPVVIFDGARNRVLAIAPDSATQVVTVSSLTLTNPAGWSVPVVTGSAPTQAVTWAGIDSSLDRVLCATDSALHDLAIGSVLHWSLLSAPPAPPGYQYGALLIDPVRHRLVHEGGAVNGSSSGGPDVWDLSFTAGDTATWRFRSLVTGAYRTGHTAYYDPHRDRMIGTGGLVGCCGGGGLILAGDTWTAALVPPAGIQFISNFFLPDPLVAPVLDPVGDQMLALKDGALWSLPLAGPPVWTFRDSVPAEDPDPDPDPPPPANSLVVTPNPSTGSFLATIRLETSAAPLSDLYDLNGRVAGHWETGMLPPGSHSLPFGPLGVPPGVYWLRIRAGSIDATTRIAIVR